MGTPFAVCRITTASAYNVRDCSYAFVQPRPNAPLAPGTEPSVWSKENIARHDRDRGARAARRGRRATANLAATASRATGTSRASGTLKRLFRAALRGPALAGD